MIFIRKVIRFSLLRRKVLKNVRAKVVDMITAPKNKDMRAINMARMVLRFQAKKIMGLSSTLSLHAYPASTLRHKYPFNNLASQSLDRRLQGVIDDIPMLLQCFHVSLELHSDHENQQSCGQTSRKRSKTL